MTADLFTGGMAGLIAPAFAAGLVVAATHVPLGREVLRRGIIFLDLAVAQIAGLGATAAAVLLGWEGVGAQLAAFACALAAALGFSRLEKHGQALQEAVIGCAFVLAASLILLLFAGDPHGGEDVGRLMAGQILWTGWGDVLRAALVSVPVLWLLLLRPRVAQKYFYPLFAASITVSVQMVGIYLVFASLILPAMATVGQRERAGLVEGWLIAAVAVGGGLALSVISDLPSGPVIVWTYAVIASTARFLAMHVGRR